MPKNNQTHHFQRKVPSFEQIQTDCTESAPLWVCFKLADCGKWASGKYLKLLTNGNLVLWLAINSFSAGLHLFDSAGLQSVTSPEFLLK